MLQIGSNQGIVQKGLTVFVPSCRGFMVLNMKQLYFVNFIMNIPVFFFCQRNTHLRVCTTRVPLLLAFHRLLASILSCVCAYL